MNKLKVLQHIKAGKIVPVLRADSINEAREIAEAIVEGGVDCLEITTTVPDAAGLINELNEQLGASVIIGAGTVLDANTAQKCIFAGAKFIVTPCQITEVIEVCRAAGVLICAGALTPTEIFVAHQAGADVVKIFPVSAVGGANYLKAVKAPLPHIELLPTGGIGLENAADFIKAGAIAVGVGGEVSNVQTLRSKGKAEISRLARQFLQTVQFV